MTGDLLHHPLARDLGWTLLHLLWQGALIGLLLAAVLTMLRHSTANARYVACCAALLTLAVCPCLSFALLAHSGAAMAARATTIAVAAPFTASHTVLVTAVRSTAALALPTGITGVADQLLPLLTFCWCIGVALMSLRLLVGCVGVRRLVRRVARPIAGELQARCMVLAHQMGITVVVELLESALIEVPSTVGWLRAVVLLPASAVSGLSPAALEALLAHELAHIRRCDYLVNLLQTALEALLFYHPATWWISRQIRQEREHCCDDLAIAVLGDARGYARALAALETCRQDLPAPALGAAGGELLPRIQRVLGAPAASSGSMPAGTAGMTLLGLFCAGALALTLPTVYREGTAVARSADHSMRRTLNATLVTLLSPRRNAAAKRLSAGQGNPSHRQHLAPSAAGMAAPHDGAPTAGSAPSYAVVALKPQPHRIVAAVTQRHTEGVKAKPSFSFPLVASAPHIHPGIGVASPPLPPMPARGQLAHEITTTVNTALQTAGNHMTLAMQDDEEHDPDDAADAGDNSNPDANVNAAITGNTAGGADGVARMVSIQNKNMPPIQMKRALQEADRAVAEAMRTAGAEVERALAGMPVQLRQARRELERARQQLRRAQRHNGK